MGDQAQAPLLGERLVTGPMSYQWSTPPPPYSHLKEIYVDFIKRRPRSALILVFKDYAGVEHKSNKFKKGNLVHWNIDVTVETNTTATLTIQRALLTGNTSFAEISVYFKPYKFSDCRIVALEDSYHRVTVNFVCGVSKSLKIGTRAGVLGSQARAALMSNVPRFFDLSQLSVEAIPPSTSERSYDVLYAAIHRLNNEILLDIFIFYRLDEENGWNVRLGWCKLCHVCQRWRHLICEFTFHLGLQIQCTNGTATVDTLDHLPPLPLLVDYGCTTSVPITAKDESGIYHALRLHDRVRQITLRLPPSILHKCAVLMDGHFPILENLSLSFKASKMITLTLPEGFTAPNMRHLALPSIGPPKRLRVLSATPSLVTLALRNIQASCYFRPRLLVERLASLPQLEELSIGFSIPIPRPSAERELLGGMGTPVTLSNLRTLRFRGVSVYLESLVAQIRAPLLQCLDITLFNQIAFALPHLSHLINITETLQLPTGKIFFGRQGVSLTTAHHDSHWSRPFLLCVICEQLDWKIDCAAQICSALIPTLSGVEELTLSFSDSVTPAEWEIDGTTWHELLRSFIGAKKLYIDSGLLTELSRALQVDEVGSEPGFLPNLEHIVAAGNLFASFIDTRRVMGRPVQFSGRPRRLRRAKPMPRPPQPLSPTSKRLSESSLSSPSSSPVFPDDDADTLYEYSEVIDYE